MLISLHLPKTAGTSFGKSLEDYFGGRLIKDYGDRPMNTPRLQRNWHAFYTGLTNVWQRFDSTDCIHGHFLPLKYLFLGKYRHCRFVTWMRNPVERLISHYYFWKRHPELPNTNSLREKVLHENWTVEKFCLTPELKNFYNQYFWGVSLDLFCFIGITDFYEEDFQYFSKHVLSDTLSLYRENTNQNKQENAYEIDGRLRKRIEAYHQQDMMLYRKALERRGAR